MEKLESNIKKEIINEIIKELSKINIDLYYTDSITIANLIYEEIQQGSLLSKQKKDIVKSLKPDDIHILISFKTSCC